ncbi:MAG TPA: hypothetical protein VME42_16565 [Steroidobacteraceae bacterium]|nr:hypothetical protein [Steroidobacteraceae bacterium]
MQARPPSPAASVSALPPPAHRRLRRALSLLSALLAAATADRAVAFTATLDPAAPLTVYLQVGVGSFTNDYIYGGQPQNNTTINTVSVSVASSVLGNGTAQSMTTNSTAAQSYWDGYTFCSVPGQLYIGGFYRTTGAATAAAQVTATVPAALTDATGDSLPFSKIHWTSSGNGDSGAEPFPAGTFVNGGVQTVGSMASNTWNESCWTFTYLNNSVPPAGTFTGVVLYTLSAP